MVHALLAAHPSAASEMADADGLLPLHLACKHGAPVGVVQRLLEACDAAGQRVRVVGSAISPNGIGLSDQVRARVSPNPGPNPDPNT